MSNVKEIVDQFMIRYEMNNRVESSEERMRVRQAISDFVRQNVVILGVDVLIRDSDREGVQQYHERNSVYKIAEQLARFIDIETIEHDNPWDIYNKEVTKRYSLTMLPLGKRK